MEINRIRVLTINNRTIDYGMIFSLIIMVFCMFFHEIPSISIVSLFSYMMLLYFFFKKNPTIIFKQLWYFFIGSAAILGCLILEFSDAYLTEIDKIAYFSGATTFIVFSYSLLLISIDYFDYLMGKKLEKSSKKMVYFPFKDYFLWNKKSNSILLIVGSLMGLIMVVYLFASVANNPSFSLGLDRFEYSESTEGGGIYGAINRISQYFLIPCIVLAVYKNSKIGVAAIVLFCAHLVWTGNKFTAIFMVLWWITAIYSQKYKDNFSFLKKRLFMIGILIVCMVVFAVIYALYINDKDIDEYMAPRFAQQGQLWWYSFNHADPPNIMEFSDEIKGVSKGDSPLRENVGSKHGIYKMMYFAAPTTKVNNKLSSGSRYTEAGFATAYYYFGIIGCILLAVIGGALASLFINLFLYYVRYNQYVRAFIMLRMIDHLTTGLLLFDFARFFNYTAIASYFILFLLRGKIIKYRDIQI